MLRSQPMSTLTLSLMFPVALTLFATAPASAQPSADNLALTPVAGASASPGDCADGQRHDDGSFETGLHSSGINAPKIVTRFDVVETSTLIRVCVCWSSSFAPGDHAFDVVVFDDDGPAGRPGTLLARESVEVTDVPPGSGTFYGFDLSALDVTVPAGGVYVGVDALDVFSFGLQLCADTNGPGNPPILAAPGGSSSNWQDARDQLSDLHALGVRVKLEAGAGPGPDPGPAPGSCTPSASVLCLDDAPGDRRFRVELAYENDRDSGMAHAVPLDDLGVTRGGLFWIGNRSNPEMLIKVLNACALPGGRYWVFYAATTNQGLVTTVTDTVTGRVWRRTNPLGTAAAPVQDTRAFPCD